MCFKMNGIVLKLVRILRIPLWIWFCIILPVQGAKHDSSCFDNCSCCKHNKCHTADLGSGNWTNVCDNGNCIDQHRGARCYELCSYDCVSCNDNANTCDSCLDGFHLGSNKNCTSKCPTNCKTCTSDTQCTSCNDGYSNKDGSTTCPFFDCPVNCVCSENTCTTCKNGFFDTGNECNQECPSNCMTCLSGDMCKECKLGFYNGYEFDNNDTQLSNKCKFKCRKSCTECQSYDYCLHCISGKYGPKCQSNCSIGCKDETCHIDYGNCICSNNFEGDRCTDCVTGQYGTNCNEDCPEHCKEDRCNRTTGYCSKYCITNTITGPLCNTCTVGMHGTLCNKSCPTNCKAETCNRTTGVCSEGCKANFKGPLCDTCIEGKYGLACDQACPSKCENSECGKETGKCLNCTRNFYGDSCEKCKPGFNGRNCNEKCSIYCNNTTCDMSTGVCDYGCTANYSGDMCCVSGLNCVSCASKTECKECDNGFYGSTCNNTCSNLCIDNICEQVSGICDNGCDGSNDDQVCGLGQTPAPQRSIGPILGGVSGALVLIIAGVVIGIFLLKRRRTGKPLEQQTKDAKTEHAREGHVYENCHDSQLLEEDVERHSNAARNGNTSSVDVDEVEIDERSCDDANRPSETYYNIGIDSHRVNVTDLLSYVATRHDETFAREFGNLAKDLDLTHYCTIAKKPENLPLNRYNGIYPYDHSRVTIAGQSEFFINACYIDGYKNRQKEYIASLGPTTKTTDKFSTFWLMVWNEKSDIIVMLTNLREASGMKCEKYWPDSDKQEDYGKIEVICRSVEVFAEYSVRTFSISKGKAKRNVVQLHYTAWPDKGVPEEVTSLVEFRQRVKAVPSILGGPFIIHCSAGVGRTGTYIALDQLTEEGKCEGSVDVFNCVNRMRKQRVNMVQTAEQYKFLYKSLVHSLSFGCEAMTAEEIQGFTYNANGNLFTDMFETLRQEVDIESKEDIEDRQENKKRHKDKNRRHSDIPANRNRVRLFLARADGHHDYINAVFINSFKTKNLFIAAQSPLPGTVEDFICMIYQQNSSCVVVLEESHNQNDLGKYLPADNETYKCGDFTVTCSKCETKEQYILKKVSIQTTKKSEVKTVFHFQYTKWGISKTIPDKVEDFVHFIKDVEKIISRQTEDQPHIVVHCLSGYERTGLFCVVYKLLEKLEAERQVSVVNTVRKIRTHRKQSITSVEQLKFCYQCISACLEIYNTYSNFAT